MTKNSERAHRALRSAAWTALALGLTLCLTAARVEAQVGPGPLSKAHQELSGVTKCLSCHQTGAMARGLKCLDCHAEIRRRVEAKIGMHGRAMATPGEECRRCHQEHKGAATPLIRLDRQKFEHQAQTGFALTGKHRQQKCEACHEAAKIPQAARAEIKLKDLNRSFLGLRRECIGCHKDQHQGQLGTDCQRCHSPEGFKPAGGFSHTTARFQLTGMHQKLACQKCHGPKPGQETAQYKGLNFNGCQNCHEDPHRGAFQEAEFRGSCDTCHNTGGFRNNRPGASFTHPERKFTLSGKHTALACAKCHKDADFRRPVAHERCRDCHQDPHKGQFNARAAGSDCKACHDTAGFKPTRFDRETHRSATFPLEGKHNALDCQKCHPGPGKDAVYRTGKLACRDCHTDRHGGEFAGAPHQNQCGDCHTPAGYLPTTFTVERHGKTQFPLVGRHAAAACEKCHPTDPASKADAPFRKHRFESMECRSCHNDPHETKRACDSCHTPEGWSQTKTFDHTTTAFRIEGAHLKLKCAQCHQPSAAGAKDAWAPTPSMEAAALNAKTMATSGAAAPGAKESTAPRFSNAPAKCSGCHRAKEPHGGQFFEGGREEECSECHTMARFDKEDFRHERARFVPNSVHRNLQCPECHKQQREAAGRMIRVYRGTPTDCVQCHPQ